MIPPHLSSFLDPLCDNSGMPSLYPGARRVRDSVVEQMEMMMFGLWGEVEMLREQ